MESIIDDILLMINKLLDTTTIISLRSTNKRFLKELNFYKISSKKITMKMLKMSNFANLEYLNVSNNKRISNITFLKQLRILKIDKNSKIRKSITDLSNLEEFYIFDQEPVVRNKKIKKKEIIEKIDEEIWNTTKNNAYYETHDNGGRPFRLINKNDTIIIFEQIYDDGQIAGIILLILNKYNKIFIGEDPSLDPYFKGNSNLIYVSKRKTGYKYIFVGDEIYSFITEDRIIEYHSLVGNSNVPYPYAIGEKYTYLMIEEVCIENKNRNDDNPYSQYYDYNQKFSNKSKKEFKEKNFKKYETKIICSRRF